MLANRTSTTLVGVRLNDRLRPYDRGVIYEDNLRAVLEARGLGQVMSGETMQLPSGEFAAADIELELRHQDEKSIGFVVSLLEHLGAPRGSRLVVGERVLSVGQNEGLALYLDSSLQAGKPTTQGVVAVAGWAAQESELGAEVEEVRSVADELEELLGEAGRLHSFWEGPFETALYLYGPSCAEMLDRIRGFVDTDPRCEHSRLVQIA